jgi:predicted ATPase with chaperone activity
VEEAQARQQDRYRSMTTPSVNARASGRALAVALSPEAKAFLHDAVDTLALSARAYNRVIKVARTIADLAESATIMSPHLAEALRYRSLGSLDRTLQLVCFGERGRCTLQLRMDCERPTGRIGRSRPLVREQR